MLSMSSQLLYFVFPNENGLDEEHRVLLAMKQGRVVSQEKSSYVLEGNVKKDVLETLLIYLNFL